MHDTKDAIARIGADGAVMHCDGAMCQNSFKLAATILKSRGGSSSGASGGGIGEQNDDDDGGEDDDCDDDADGLRNPATNNGVVANCPLAYHTTYPNTNPLPNTHFVSQITPYSSIHVSTLISYPSQVPRRVRIPGEKRPPEKNGFTMALISPPRLPPLTNATTLPLKYINLLAPAHVAWHVAPPRIMYAPSRPDSPLADRYATYADKSRPPSPIPSVDTTTPPTSSPS
jgi:hypothetical protein